MHMSTWDEYPADYRSRELGAILTAINSGECVSLVGLSGSGKSNLLGFLVNRQELFPSSSRFILVDCNRLKETSLEALFSAVLDGMSALSPAGDRGNLPVDRGLDALETAVNRILKEAGGLCLLFDRFEPLAAAGNPSIFSNLRALRDRFKYSLTYLIATRRPLDPLNELAELFFANTLWLGPLSESDGRWNVERYARRKSLDWEAPTVEAILRLSGAYPSLLRAICEASAAGAPLDLASLRKHPSVVRRVEEFWSDAPTQEELRLSGLLDNPLLARGQAQPAIDEALLTAKEHLLWAYFQAHPDRVCEKDDLIRAVWPEDRVFEHGIRDDSLAQLVRRLREKTEPDPSSPEHIQTVPGRGYRYSRK